MKQIRKIKNVFPLIFFSNGIAILIALISIGFFMPKPSDKDFGSILATGLAASWLIQTWIFKIKKLKESQFVDHKWYKKTYKLTSKELDEFIDFNYRISTYIKMGVVVFTFIHPRGREICPGLFLGLMVIGFIVKGFMVKFGKLKAPKGIYKISGSPIKPEYKSPYRGIDTANQLGSGITMLKSD